MVNNEMYGEKEEAILNAAIEVFTEKGFHGTKMQEIADRAGTNKALLHYYFRSKERLYSHIFERVFKKFIAGSADIPDGSSGIEDILYHFIDRFINVLKQNPKIPMFIIHELSQGGKTASRIVSNFMQTMPDLGPWRLIRIIEEAAKRGEIDTAVDGRQFLITLLGACIYFFMAEPIVAQVLSSDDSYDRERFLKERKKAIFNTLMYGIKPRGDKQP